MYNREGIQTRSEFPSLFRFGKDGAVGCPYSITPDESVLRNAILGSSINWRPTRRIRRAAVHFPFTTNQSAGTFSASSKVVSCRLYSWAAVSQRLFFTGGFGLRAV
jgi:hypothetical protein